MRLVHAAMLALLAAVGLAALFVALTVPYHATDAFVYGSWSRRIADTGQFHLPGIGNSYLSRPFFLVTQGWLWRAFGLHEWIGRLWSLCFGLLLVWSLLRLAARERLTEPRAVLAAVVLLAIPEFAQGAFAGLTDVPAASLTALIAVLLWTVVPGRRRWAALVIVAALATLTKSTILPAVVGVGLAHLVGPRGELRSRLLWGCVPVAVGVLVALVYDATQASYLHQGLYQFLTGGNAADPHLQQTVDLNRQVNQQGRQSVVLGLEWLGPYLVLPLLFAGAYALGRLGGWAHRRAATLAAPVAIVLSVLLPLLASSAGDRTVSPFDPKRPAALLFTLALVVPLWLARDCPEDETPSRVDLGRWVVWAVPTLIAWIQVAPENVRYVAGVWVPLVLLIAAVLWCAARGAAERLGAPRGAWVGAAVIAAVLCTALADLRNFDALGARPDGSINAWRTVSDLGLSGWFHPSRARSAADPQLGGMLLATQRAAGAGGTVLTNDGRYVFFFPGRVTVRTPRSCADASHYGVVALVTNDLGLLARSRFDRLAPDTRRLIARGAPDPQKLAGCLRTVASVPGSYAVFSGRA